MICTATKDNVDVFVSGYVFRLKIWHERGLNLLRKESKNSSDSHIFVGCLSDCLM